MLHIFLNSIDIITIFLIIIIADLFSIGYRGSEMPLSASDQETLRTSRIVIVSGTPTEALSKEMRYFAVISKKFLILSFRTSESMKSVRLAANGSSTQRYASQKTKIRVFRNW